MRICLVYDCLYPHTVGGGERWYRNLAEQLTRDGHDVTYLTLRQWEPGADPGVPGVEVVAVGPRMALYGAKGTRRVLPPLIFGAGVCRHLLVHGRRYDVVQTASFPFFSLLAASALRRLRGYRLVVDWFEVWTREYWRQYLGAPGGAVGAFVQRRCARARQQAFCFSRLHARRLVQEGMKGEPVILEGIYAGPLEPADPGPAEPLVVFAGRHIPEKRVSAIPAAIAAAARDVPGLRCEIFGDGPDRAEVQRAVAREGVEGAVALRGFVEGREVEGAMRRALCVVLPSRREGYGLVVVEAASQGTPSVVVADPDNAATELVSDGENGFVAESASKEDLSRAIVRVHLGGPALRRSTVAWFAANARRLSIGQSLARVSRVYGSDELSARR